MERFSAATLYRLLPSFIAACCLASGASAMEPGEAGIGYQSVEAALDALKSRSDVNIFEKDGWTIVEDAAGGALWSFTPATHAAHPAAVKRTVVEENGQVFIDTKGLCQAVKPACDRLMAEFRELNERIGRSAGPAGTRTGQDDRYGPPKPSPRE